MNDRAPVEPKAVFNESGLEVKPLYTRADVDASGGEAMIGAPRRIPPSPAASTA